MSRRANNRFQTFTGHPRLEKAQERATALQATAAGVAGRFAVVRFGGWEPDSYRVVRFEGTAPPRKNLPGGVRVVFIPPRLPPRGPTTQGQLFP